MTGQFSKALTTVAIGVVLGSILCLIGIASPYWIVVKGGTIYLGLWQVCLQDDGLTECETMDMEDVKGYYHAIRGCALACLFLGCVSGIMAISFAIGRQDSKPISVGIISFIGGLCGLIAVGIFVGKEEEAKANSKMAINLNDYVKYGWAFGLFCAGAAVLIVFSIVAFCASPNNPIRGYIFNQPSLIVTQAGPNPYHNMSSTTGVIINQSQTSYGIPYYGHAEPGYGVRVVTK